MASIAWPDPGRDTLLRCPRCDKIIVWFRSKNCRCPHCQVRLSSNFLRVVLLGCLFYTVNALVFFPRPPGNPFVEVAVHMVLLLVWITVVAQLFTVYESDEADK